MRDDEQVSSVCLGNPGMRVRSHWMTLAFDREKEDRRHQERWKGQKKSEKDQKDYLSSIPHRLR